jgi:hypothetical protein
MSLSIFDRGEGRFDLVRNDDEIGWIVERTVGFTGFGDRSSARRAASVAYKALSGWLARQRRLDAPPRNDNALDVRRAGTTDQLTLGEVAVGRLWYRHGRTPYDGAYAFELALPPRIGATLSAAQVMYYALERDRAARDARTVPDVA